MMPITIQNDLHSPVDSIQRVMLGPSEYCCARVAGVHVQNNAKRQQAPAKYFLNDNAFNWGCCNYMGRSALGQKDLRC